MAAGNERASPAVLSSLLLHGSIVVLIVFAGYLADQARPPVAKVFDLVAGPGDNYRATEAPALGEPDGIALKVPQVASVPRPPAPEPVVPVEPAPVTPTPVADAAPPTPAPTPVKAASKTTGATAVPNFKRMINKRITHLLWVEKQREIKARKAAEAEQRRLATAQHMTYGEYLKQHGDAAAVASRGIHGGVTGGTSSAPGAGGHALTREQEDELSEYFAELKIKLRDEFAAPPDASDRLVAEVAFYLAADGSISRARITRSSGSAAFDEAVLEAFHRVRMPPRPDHTGEDDELDFSLREDTGE